MPSDRGLSQADYLSMLRQRSRLSPAFRHTHTYTHTHTHIHMHTHTHTATGCDSLCNQLDSGGEHRNTPHTPRKERREKNRERERSGE